MKTINFAPVTLIFLLAFITGNFFCQDQGEKSNMRKQDSEIIQLPSPNYNSNTSIEEAISKRRSVRDFSNVALSISDVAQLLWAAQGITEKNSGLRTAPSAGATYPLEVYLLSSNVKYLNQGLYKYNPHDHTLKFITEGDKRSDIANAALKQGSIEKSSAMIILTAVYERTSARYGNRTERYVNMEIGHAGQNIYLQAVSLGLGTVMIGAFNDDAMKKVLNLPENEYPLAIYPVGRL